MNTFTQLLLSFMATPPSHPSRSFCTGVRCMHAFNSFRVRIEGETESCANAGGTITTARLNHPLSRHPSSLMMTGWGYL